MKKYKVLSVNGGELYSPYRNYCYGKMHEVTGRQLICSDFDESKKDCSRGFYATDIDGIIYSLNRHLSNKVFEVEVGGLSAVIDTYKQRFEKQTILRQVPDDELKTLIKEQSEKMDWDYYHACYPPNPLLLDVPFEKETAINLLKDWSSVRTSVGNSIWTSVGNSIWDSVWASVWDSVRASVGNSVRTSVGNSIWASVWDSVWASVWDSVGAYCSSFFPKIKKWRYINHEEGANPFQSVIDLWHMGLVPGFDGNVWRLHKGEKAEVVIELRRVDDEKSI